MRKQVRLSNRTKLRWSRRNLGSRSSSKCAGAASGPAPPSRGRPFFRTGGRSDEAAQDRFVLRGAADRVSSAYADRVSRPSLAHATPLAARAEQHVRNSRARQADRAVRRTSHGLDLRDRRDGRLMRRRMASNRGSARRRPWWARRSGSPGIAECSVAARSSCSNAASFMSRLAYAVASA